MAVEIDPDRGDAVQITATIGVLKIDPITSLDDQGSGPDPIALLGERVPEVSAILGLKPLGAGLARHEGWAIIGRGIRFDNPMKNLL
jgi:hypothetical protein